MAELYEGLQQQLREAPSPVTPGSFPEIDKFFAPTRSAAIFNPAIQATGRAAGDVATAQRAAEAQARQRQKDEQDKAEEYRREPNETGGFTFFRGDIPITPFEYARGTDTQLTSILADSIDPGDQKFIEDYSYWQAIAQDPQVVIRDSLAGLKLEYDDGANNPDTGAPWQDDEYREAQAMIRAQSVNPKEKLQGLIKRYQHIFGGSQ